MANSSDGTGTVTVAPSWRGLVRVPLGDFAGDEHASSALYGPNGCPPAKRLTRPGGRRALYNLNGRPRARSWQKQELRLGSVGPHELPGKADSNITFKGQ
jgi:hypothetical protein